MQFGMQQRHRIYRIIVDRGQASSKKTIKFRSFLCALPLVVISNSYSFSGIYCSEPSAPSFYDRKPTKPSVPFCVNEFMKTHTCDDFTISQYNSEVETYNSRLRSYNSSVEIYIAELNRYVQKARDYAQCEVDNL